MKLTEWDYNAGDFGAYIEREYPDAPFRAFIEWFRNTKQWRESGGFDMVYQKFRKLELDLADIRTEQARQPEPERCTATTRAGEPCRGKPVQDGLCISHLKQAQAA